MILNCATKDEFRFTGFGTFTTKQDRKKYARTLGRKHTYTNDFLSNQLHEAPVQRNMLKYKAKAFTKTFFNSHGLFNFLDIKKMNKNIMK